MNAAIFWRGVTLLEEHEVTPTYEVVLAGCPLRCPYCAVPGASRGGEGSTEHLSPAALLDDLAHPRHPPFRALSLVGGEPTSHMAWIRELLPLARARRPETLLVLNTALCWEPELAPELAAGFDWVVGTVRTWGSECALGAPAAYPAQARAAAEALLAAGGRLLLRILLLPGHLDCCAQPLAAWAAGLGGEVRVSVLTNYAPVGEARSIAGLDRPLSAKERTMELLAPGVVRPLDRPIEPIPVRGPGFEDPPVPLEIDPHGRVFAPFVTGDLLPWLADREPTLRARLVYLGS
ncbi:MAG: radical SAM protein [Pseudomonadota bacterium]